MTKNFLSRYRPAYVRSLLYMLQASEYSYVVYLAWYHRSADFTHIEVRKSLQRTRKATLLLAAAWVILIAMYALGLSVAILAHSLFGILIGFVILLLAPYLLAYAMLVVLAVVKLVQWPVESSLVSSARRTLAVHRAIKIAIAGSYGKTTMREILKTVLAEGKKVAAVPHSYNTQLGISSFVKNLKGDEEILIFELGEYHVGDVAELCRFVQPDMGIVTGVNEAHLEKFESLDKTAATIFELADWLGSKPLYVNGEDAIAKSHAQDGSNLYSRLGAGDLVTENINSDLGGTSFTLKHAGKELPYKSGLLGLHQVGPLVAAAHIAFSFGLTPGQVQSGIAKTKAFDHRLEPKTDASGVITLDDSYNGNPTGVKAIIDFLSGIKGHRRFYVTPGLVEMGARTAQVHLAIGAQLAGSGIENVVLVKNSVTAYIAEGLQSAGYRGTLTWFDTGLAAYAALPQMTVSGDIVVLQNDWPDQYA